MLGKKFLGTLFGSGEAVSQLTGSIASGVDKLKFTAEEKAEHFLNMLKLYEPFKLAQRYLSLIFCTPYVLIWTIYAFLSLFGHSQLNDSVLNGRMGDAVALIIAFYFGGGALNGIIEKFKENKK